MPNPRAPLTLSRRTATPVLTGLLLACILTLGALAACEKKEGKPHGMPPVPASTAKAEARDAPLMLQATGHVEAYNSVSIRPQVTALLEKALFENGQDVAKGALLFSLDQRPFQMSLNQAMANLSGNRAKASQAQRDSARYQNLVGSGAVSRDDFEQKATAATTAGTDAAANLAAAEIARQNLSYCSIYAPFTGRMGQRLKDPGNLAVANQDVLAVINQITPIKVMFSLPEQYLPQVRAYLSMQPLRVKTTALGLPDPEWGVVTMFDNAVDPKTGMVLIESLFENRHKQLWPGQYVNVDLELTMEKGRVVVPARAIMRGPEGTIAFVVKADNTIEVRPVVKGRRIGDDILVDKGLFPGETVVTDGHLGLYPGATIIPAPSPDEKRAREGQPPQAEPKPEPKVEPEQAKPATQG